MSPIRRFRLAAGLSRRLPGGGRGLWLVLLALLGHLFLPLGALQPMAADVPDADICVTAPQSGPSPAAPGSSHDDPCCTLHCLSCGGGGGLPATPPAQAAVVDFRLAAPRAARREVPPESHPAPFSARAPPLPA